MTQHLNSWSIKFERRWSQVCCLQNVQRETGPTSGGERGDFDVVPEAGQALEEALG